jgi:Outer membrane efflux protein
VCPEIFPAPLQGRGVKRLKCREGAERSGGYETCLGALPMRPSFRTVLRATVVGLTLGNAALPLKEARAEAPPVKVMTLTEALAYARAHQPAIRAAMARVAAQQEEARVPRAEWLPSVGATVQGFAATANNSTGTYVGSPFVDVLRIGGTKVAAPGSARPYASTFLGAGINQ